MKPISATPKSCLDLISVFYCPLHSELSGHNFFDLLNLTMVFIENIPEPMTVHKLFGSNP
jgi:hypothetical protein